MPSAVDWHIGDRVETSQSALTEPKRQVGTPPFGCGRTPSSSLGGDRSFVGAKRDFFAVRLVGRAPVATMSAGDRFHSDERPRCGVCVELFIEAYGERIEIDGGWVGDAVLIAMARVSGRCQAPCRCTIASAVAGRVRRTVREFDSRRRAGFGLV